MSGLVHAYGREQILRDLRVDLAIGRHLGVMAATTLIGGALYGFVLGWWHGTRLALYVSIKVPLLLLGTAVVTALFNWVFAALAGAPMRLRQTFALTLFPPAIAAIVAASLSPIAWFFSESLPPPGPAQRTLHNLLYVTHTALIAAAGFAGTLFLRRALVDVCGGNVRRAARIHAAWVCIYAFVAGEMAWALRPFIGSVYLPVVFLRPNALEGNVYEFILTDIIPHLFRRLTGG